MEVPKVQTMESTRLELVTILKWNVPDVEICSQLTKFLNHLNSNPSNIKLAVKSEEK